MPRLVLQPLVENCFNHGFRDKTPPWEIRIYIVQEDDQWFITVQDNGNGFDPEVRASLLAKIDSETRGEATALQIGGLGLHNTIMRMRLVTNDDLYWDIRSAEADCPLPDLAAALVTQPAEHPIRLVCADKPVPMHDLSGLQKQLLRILDRNSLPFRSQLLTASCESAAAVSLQELNPGRAVDAICTRNKTELIRCLQTVFQTPDIRILDIRNYLSTVLQDTRLAYHISPDRLNQM